MDPLGSGYPVADYPLMEEEDHDTGYETIIVASQGGHRDIGAPLSQSQLRGSSVIVNSAARQRGNFRPNSWNANPRSGFKIQHFNSLPPDSPTPRIVEVTGMEEEEEEMENGIDDPDYPRSDRGGAGSRFGEYPTLPADAAPPLPDRDYHHGRGDEESRPDIHRVNLSAGDRGDPPGVTVIPPAPPPPLIHSQTVTPAQPTQTNSETNPAENQELHIVLRRALARNFDTTQPTRDETDNRGDEETGEQVPSREIYTQTQQTQSTEVQTTLDRHDDGRQRSDNRGQSDSRDTKRTSRGDDRRSQQRNSYQHDWDGDEGQHGPRFSPDPLFDDHSRSQSHGQNAGATDNQLPTRSSRIIERIIITREIDPDTGHPIEEMPMRSMGSRPQSMNRAPPTSNIAYNHSVRESGRRSRGRGPFSDWQGHWSPREGNDHVNLTGIVAGMESDMDFETDQHSYMPRETAERRGRANQGYNVSPDERRRHRDVERTSSQPIPMREPWQNVDRVLPPPPYTERDIPPARHNSSPTSPLDRASGHGWGRPERPRDWPADSDGSSTIAAGWTQRTRVVFGVMLLLCILLLLSLVIVVTLYFTAGPGRDCLNGTTCESPPVGYIAAFAIIGVLALSFMLIGVILCCFACRLSREKRMQHYPVSARR